MTLDLSDVPEELRAAVEAALTASRGQNLFGLHTQPLVAAIESMPTVAAARVDVHLPGTLAVTITERTPVLVWQIGRRRYLADAGGSLFAELADPPAAGAAALPVVDDRRAASGLLGLGGTLDPVDLDAATRLASLKPADVGSGAVSLMVAVSDENGFVIGTRPNAWSAVFGFYTPSLRKTDLIPGQTQVLKNLLLGREPTVAVVILGDDRDGTYIPKATPSPSASPKP